MSAKAILFVIVFTLSIFPQSIKVNLNAQSKLQEDDFHIVTLASEPNENLILPKALDNEINITKKYFKLFHSWDNKNDQDILVLVYQFKDEDLLYIDKNNDNDLTDDGGPILFPLNKDSVSFDIITGKDKKQKLRLALFRKPDLPDSSINSVVDRDGNLTSEYSRIAGMLSNDLNFTGKKRSFYFDYKITLKTGRLRIDSTYYLVGLFDFTNNGKFNDSLDLFIIDLKKKGKLNTLIPSNIFSIDDVFSIDGKNYKLKDVDKYGEYIVIERTNKKPTFHYLEWIQKELSKSRKKGKLKPEFWKNKLVTLDSKIVNLSDYKGKYIFMNFWGEWCLPCINEVDELKAGYIKYNNKIIFIGIMKVDDLEKAREIINSKGINWQNFFISDEIKNEFKITRFPTNILIYPDGLNYIKDQGINRTFFDINIK